MMAVAQSAAPAVIRVIARYGAAPGRAMSSAAVSARARRISTAGRRRAVRSIAPRPPRARATSCAVRGRATSRATASVRAMATSSAASRALVTQAAVSHLAGMRPNVRPAANRVTTAQARARVATRARRDACPFRTAPRAALQPDGRQGVAEQAVHMGDEHHRNEQAGAQKPALPHAWPITSG